MSFSAILFLTLISFNLITVVEGGIFVPILQRRETESWRS